MAANEPKGPAAVGIFLLFATTMASLAGLTLTFPGTKLDCMWTLNPAAHQQLAPLGRVVGILFLLLAAVLLAATLGWRRRRRWGWLLTVFIIATQILGDALNLARGELLRGGIGVVIAGCLLAYLLRPSVKRAFPRNDFTQSC
jgi:hypothetical protein